MRYQDSKRAVEGFTEEDIEARKPETVWDVISRPPVGVDFQGDCNSLLRQHEGGNSAYPGRPPYLTQADLLLASLPVDPSSP